MSQENQPQPGKSPRILVVDDDPGIMGVIKARLEANDYQVTCASNGEEGVKMAQSGNPDLIIMDIMMPKMQGGDAVRLLRTDSKTQHIPVLFLTAVTANMPQGAEDRGINVDGQYYPAIAKPFKSEKLLFEIKKLIGD